MAQDIETLQSGECASAPFEGPEKLLEIWFASSANDMPAAASTSFDNGRTGLRKVSRQVWEEMLDIVQCKVLSVIEGKEMDAYLLSESSFFVSPHRLILKTCGTTLNLYGLPRMLEIARDQAHLPLVHRLFYSRKSFMFPERQLGPHRNWNDEVQYLDNIFSNGAAYTVGKVNGDHWLLYLTSSPGNSDASIYGDTAPSSPVSLTMGLPAQDYTIEILMSNLSHEARKPFFSPIDEISETPSCHAQLLSSNLGISDIFPSRITTLDAYSFSPCGYSSNALLKWGEVSDSDVSPSSPNCQSGDLSNISGSGEGYYTIHVTPEEGWSYASFECNVPLSAFTSNNPKNIPDLETLIRRVVDIFQPGRLSLTLFVSSRDNNSAEDEEGESAVDQAQKAFKAALMGPTFMQKNGLAIQRERLYKRTDKINYEFGGYDLAFASFEFCA